MTLIGGSYLSADMLSVYSTAPANWLESMRDRIARTGKIMENKMEVS